VVYGPHDEGEDDAEEDAGGYGKVDGPSAAAPGEVAGETAEREMETAEAEDDQASGDEKNAEEDEGAAEVRHGRVSGRGEEGGDFAEEL
jgi:hypothetical protein